MPKSSNQGKHSKLSAEFPIFIFEEFTFSTNENGVNASFHFNLGDRYHFYPTLFIPLKNRVLTDESLNSMLPTLIFHIGMIELISYWKAACSRVEMLFHQRHRRRTIGQEMIRQDADGVATGHAQETWNVFLLLVVAVGVTLIRAMNMHAVVGVERTRRAVSLKT